MERNRDISFRPAPHGAAKIGSLNVTSILLMCSWVLEAKSISILYKYLVTYPFHFWISAGPRIFRFDHRDPWTMQHEAFCSAARASMLSAPLRGSCQRRYMSGNNTLQITTENSETTQVKNINHLQSSEIHLNHQYAEVVIRMPAWMRLAFWMDLLVPFGFVWHLFILDFSCHSSGLPIWGATGNHRARHVPGLTWFWPEALVVYANLSGHSVLSRVFARFLLA